MTQAYRLVHPQFADQALTGAGARLYGGRWNNPGVAMTYTAGSISLAALELLVHLEYEQILQYYQLIPIHFAEKYTKTIALDDLPKGWNDDEIHPVTQQMGDHWIAQQTSLVLAVPSVLIPDEKNYLINPVHPDFVQLNAETPRTFTYPQRLKKTN